MSSKTKSGLKGSPDEAVKTAVQKKPGSTTGEIAQAAGIGRSTAGKALGRLVDAGEVTRHQGGRDGGRRLPDRFTLAGVKMPAAHPAHDSNATPAAATSAKSKATGKPKRSEASAAKTGKSDAAGVKAGQGASSTSQPDGGKLKPGGLDPLVLGYLEDNADSGPHGPTQIAKALQRSSGAVGNCLTRLTDAKKVKLATQKPRRYSLT